MAIPKKQLLLSVTRKSVNQCHTQHSVQCQCPNAMPKNPETEAGAAAGAAAGTSDVPSKADRCRPCLCAARAALTQASQCSAAASTQLQPMHALSCCAQAATKP